MDIFRILKLLQRNLLLLILVPVILVIIVAYLTRKPDLKYESDTTIYTGFASGYSLDQDKGFNLFATNNTFDNLINIIQSRDVAIETGIRLFTQNLMLKSYNPSYIGKEDYINLHRKTPKYIKDLIIHDHEIDTSAQASAIDVSNGNGADSIFLENGDFVFDNKLIHTVKADETLFSIAKDNNIAVSDLMNINNLIDYAIEPGKNIILKDGNRIARDSTIVLFDSADIKMEVAKLNLSNYEKSVQILMAYAMANDTNYIYKLLNSSNPYYSIDAIKSVTVRRVQSSDLITLKFTSYDPGICLQTLTIISEVFIRKFKTINENSSDAVVKYFINEVNKSAKRLQKAEERLLEFNKRNNIINYYEQSKAVANVKEELDLNYQKEQIRYESAASVLKKLEEKLSVQDKIQLKTAEILELRDKLSNITSQITLTEVYQDPDPKNRAKLEDLKNQSDKLKKNLEGQIGQFYIYTNTTDGLPLTDLLTQWLANVVVYEESKASMRVLASRIRDFSEYYKTFAPLGSTQKKIEREINVAEQEYLSLLHSLNLSKLKQQNIELSSNIKAVDPPYFPLKPIPGKEKLLVIAAGLFGFLLVLILILALEYFDNTIRTPDRLEEFSKLRIAGTFPRVNSRYKNYNFEFITNRLIELMVHNIRYNALNGNHIAKPRLIILFSPMRREGKTFLGSRIAHKLREFGERTAFITFVKPNEPDANSYLLPSSISRPHASNVNNDLRKRASKVVKPSIWERIENAFKLKRRKTSLISEPEPSYDNFRYLADTSYIEAVGLSSLNYVDTPPSLQEYKYILLEIPSIIYNPYPMDIFSQADVSIMQVRSNRVWKKSDTLALTTVIKVLKDKPLGILNGVEIDVLENILGELPKRRSHMRRALKQLLSLQFHEKQTF